MSQLPCSRCHEAKPESDFYRNKSRPSGRSQYCKKCTDLKNRARRTSRGRMQYLARAAVNNAIANRRMSRRPCELCGSERSQAHHDDYSRPLEVRWLCRKHHAEWHKHNTPLFGGQNAN